MFDDTKERGNNTPSFEEGLTMQPPTEKAKKVVGVWCLTPLSTIFQL